MQNANEETVGAGNLVPSTGPRNPKRLDHTGARTRVLYVSESALGIRVRHRYDRVLHAYVRDEVPKDAKRWDKEARCWIFDDGEHLQELFRRAKRRGWGIAVDDGTADTRRPVGVQRTWADTLGFEINEEDRPEVMLDVLAVLERYEAQGVVGADKAARKVRDFISWAC